MPHLGIDKVITEHPELVQDAVAIEELRSKNVGEPKKLRKWSRGHQFIVCAGGHRHVTTTLQVHKPQHLAL